MTKQLTEAEVKAEILDLSDELILAIVQRLEPQKHDKLIEAIYDRCQSKLGIVNIWQTDVDYQLERLHEDLASEYCDAGEEPPHLPEDGIHNLLQHVANNHEIGDGEYEEFSDNADDALRRLHREKFPDWWAQKEAEDAAQPSP